LTDKRERADGSNRQPSHFVKTYSKAAERIPANS